MCSCKGRNDRNASPYKLYFDVWRPTVYTGGCWTERRSRGAVFGMPSGGDKSIEAERLKEEGADYTFGRHRAVRIPVAPSHTYALAPWIPLPPYLSERR